MESRSKQVGAQQEVEAAAALGAPLGSLDQDLEFFCEEVGEMGLCSVVVTGLFLLCSKSMLAVNSGQSLGLQVCASTLDCSRLS